MFIVVVVEAKLNKKVSDPQIENTRKAIRHHASGNHYMFTPRVDQEDQQKDEASAKVHNA